MDKGSSLTEQQRISAFDGDFGRETASERRGELHNYDPTQGRCYLFYRSFGAVAHENSLPSPYVTAVWSPSIRRPWPTGAAAFEVRGRFLFRSTLHFLRLLANRESGALCVYCA